MSEYLCVSCGKPAGRKRKIGFIFKGHHFVVIKTSFRCAVCVEKKVARRFSKYCTSFVSLGPDKPKVNWSVYLQNDKFTESVFVRHKIIDVLVCLRIFSLSKKGNWDIISADSQSLTPKAGGIMNVYFTNGNDALVFARLKFESRKDCKWEICKYSEVISDEKVLSLPDSDDSRDNPSYD